MATQDEIEHLRARVAELERERQIPAEIVEKSPVMISIVRAPDFIYELVNPAFQALAPGKKFLGRRFADVWAEISEPLVGVLQNVIDTGRTFELEDAPYTIEREPGAPPELVYVRYSWIPLPGPDGKPDRILTLAHETTASVRQRQETAESNRLLREKEAILRSFFDSAGVMRGIVELQDGCIIHVSCNQAAAKLFGVDGDSIPGKSAIELGADEGVAQAWVGLYEESRRTGKPASMEYARRDADGQDRWLLATASYLGAGPSPSPRFAYTIRDLTERKRAEEALVEREARYRTLSETMLQGVLYHDAEGNIVSMNPAAETIMGKTLAELVGTTSADVAHDLIREDGSPFPGLEHPSMVALATGREVRAVRMGVYNPREKQYRWIEINAIPLFQTGEPKSYQVYTIFEDVTERKLAEEALRESESRLRTLSDNLPEGAIYRYRQDVHGETHVDFISAGIERLTGVPAAEFMADAATVYRNILPEDHGRLDAAIAFSRDAPTQFEVEVRHPHRATGEIRWSLLRATPTRNTDGSTTWDGIELDITSRKRAEAALAESARRERFLAGLLEMAEQPFAIGYPDGRVGICNRAYCELTGYSVEELQSASWTEVLTPAEWMEQEMAALAELERTGKPVRYEKEYLRKDGRRVPVELLVHAVRNESGKVEFYYSFLTDITERKRIGEALRRSRDELELRVQERTRALSEANRILSAQIEERERAQAALHESELAFRILAESVPQLVWTCDPDGRCIYFNRRWVEYTGLTLEESYGAGWNKPFHPDDRQAAWQAWNHAVDSGEIYRMESRLRRADGSYRWFLMRGVPSRDETGQILKWFGTCTDIDDLKRAEQEVRASKERLAMAMKVGRSGTFEWDIPNNVNIWTPELEELYGLPPGTFGGSYEDWEAFVLPEDRRHAQACLEEALITGEYFSEWRIQRFESGEIRWIVAHARVVFDEQGRPLCMVGFNHDITERKQAQQEVLRLNQDLERRVAERTVQLERIAAELEKRNREVERVNRMKTEFLARSSHELRTPLNAIVGYSDLLGEQSFGPLPPPYPRFVANIQEGARHLLDMVNDLLDLSRIEAGRIELNLERFDIPAVLDEVLSVITPLAEIKNISVDNRIARDTAVVADRLRFKQILYNLMSNAVKFTPEEGRVWIETATDGETFTICVGDTGIGIAPGEQDAIFEEFHQVASAGKMASAGTGLGLAITRKLAKLHGGGVRVESEMGKGSRFLVSMPVAGESVTPGKMEGNA
jgi:PAS domain S-box-containing protein